MTVIQDRGMTSSITAQTADFTPIRMVEAEIGRPLPTLSAFDEKHGRHYQYTRCLVRLHTQPLGLVELKFAGDELSPGAYASQIWQHLHVQINDHLAGDRLSEVTALMANGIPGPTMPRCIDKREHLLASAPFVSVIVPTHDRPDLLTVCLDALLHLHYPRYEIIVVDNAPATNVTVELVEKFAQSAPHIRYVREDRQGPSWARNRGIMMAEGKILAFTDDDVVVDAYWLAGLVRGFEEDGPVACVTGLVLPLELETPAQFLFEEVGGYNKGFRQRIIDFKENPLKLPLHPYIADRFGTGASMAFTAAFIRSVGGFDPALGRVGPVRCSQDIAVFFQLLARGYTLVYEPASLAYHAHRRNYEHLRRQTYNHAVGYTAFLTKSLSEHPRLVFDFLGKLPYALFYNLKARFSKENPQLPQYAKVIHKELILIRRKGLLYGPLAYLRSRWQIRNIKWQSSTRNRTHDSTTTH